MTLLNIAKVFIPLFFGVLLGFLLGSAHGQPRAEFFGAYQDTIIVVEECPQNVVGKKSLIIGDSHSAFVHGWQSILGKSTGMKIINKSIEGKQTSWMKSTLSRSIDSTYEFCFIYGGGNDAAAGISPSKVFSNVQEMVDLCNSYGVKAVVITGSSTGKVLTPSSKWSNYSRIKTEFQKILVENLKEASPIDVREIIEKEDCADFLCHMQISGHRKIANKIIEDLNLLRINP